MFSNKKEVLHISAVKKVYTILKILTLVTGLLVSGIGFMLSYDAASLQINPNDFSNNFEFALQNTTVQISTYGIITHGGYVFTFSDVNITIIIAVNASKTEVASQTKFYTLAPKDSVNVSFTFNIPMSVFLNADGWYILVFVHGAMTYHGYNFVSFDLTTSREV